MSETPRRRGRPLKARAPRDPFARELWDWFQRTGVTQEGAARALGVTPRTLQRWISGDRKPSDLVKEAVRARMRRGIDAQGSKGGQP